MKNPLILLLVILSIGSAFSQNSIQYKEILPPYMSVSPTISELQNSTAETLSPHLKTVWERVRKEGSPLIEKDPFFDEYVYLTLLYQDSTKNKDIRFDIFGLYDEYRFGDMKMYRLNNTDLYYRSYMVPADICFSYRFVVKDTISGNTFYDTDKFNKNRIPTGKERKLSYSVADLCPDKPDRNEKRFENTGSKIDTLVFDSEVMNNSRNIYVYLPPDYSEQQPEYPVIYLFDSFIYMNRVEVPNILDNLIKEGKIEPMVAVMIDNPTGKRNTELPLNFQFKAFVTSELIPAMRKKYHLSSVPDKNIVGGISYGGLAATFMAFYHPEIFGKVLSQSGSFWRDIDLKDHFGNEYKTDWLTKKFLTEEKKELKIFLDWGLQENWCLQAGRRMTRVLDKKGYEYKFIEFNGWHDWSNSRKTFPVGLMYLITD